MPSFCSSPGFLQKVGQLFMKSTLLHEHHSANQLLSEDSLLYISSQRFMGIGPEHTTESAICVAVLSSNAKFSLVVSDCRRRTSFTPV